jgi:hypothetical protein
MAQWIFNDFMTHDTREGLDGAYIVVAQDRAKHPFEADHDVLRTYGHLTHAIRRSGLETVIVNFADVFGLACMALGATGIATGHSQSVRRLSFEGFADRQGGKAFPQFYSHRAMSEFYTEKDLDVIVARRLLGRVRDTTPFSENLMAVLGAGGFASQVAEWAESVNNVAQAHKHFIVRMLLEARAIERVPDSQRMNSIREWLEEAAATQAYLAERFARQDRQISGTVAPAQDWLDVCDQIIE